jgi:ATP-dependent Lon protease
MTDSTQNDEFEDKFFAGIKIDLSKALIVFSFNDPALIDPILRDRITIIETHPLSLKEKTTIIKDYMFPEICKEVGFNKEEITAMLLDADFDISTLNFSAEEPYWTFAVKKK